MRVNAYTYANADSYSHLYANSYSYGYPNSYGYLYANSYSHGYPDSDGYLYANSSHGTDSNGYLYANSYSHVTPTALPPPTATPQRHTPNTDTVTRNTCLQRAD